MEPQTPQSPTPQPFNTMPTVEPQSVPQYQQPTPSHSSHKKLWIILAIVGTIVAVIGAGLFALYTFLLSPQAQTVLVSTGFMRGLDKQDATAALKYVDGPTDSATISFVQKAAKENGTSSKIVQHTYKDGKGYFLYTLNDSTNKHGRTTVAKVNGSWKVTNYVYGANDLALIPGDSVSTTNTPSTTTTPTTSTCLAANNYDGIYQELNGTTRPSTQDYTAKYVYYYDNVHFVVNTLNYDNAQLSDGVITAFANFAKTNSTKNFAINLRGSVGTTLQSDLDFANQRAQKVQQALIQKGVPSNLIIIDTPSNVGAYGSGSGDSTQQQSARAVILAINDPCTGSAVDAGYSAATASNR